MPNHPLLRTVGSARLATVALVAVCLLCVHLLLVGQAPASAEPSASKVKSAFIAVTGEGSTARGWFPGTPPPGLELQQALDKFAEDGYRIVDVTVPLEGAAARVTWYILLERVE